VLNLYFINWIYSLFMWPRVDSEISRSDVP